MEEKILNILINMQSDVCDMKNNINEMKSDISEMKRDIRQLKQRMDRLEKRMDNLEENSKITDQKHDRNYIELKNQRQIDSNNIAKILNLQTQIINKLDNRMYA